MEKAPYYLTKSKLQQDAIVRHPKRLPIAAYHLAAIRLQRHFRERRRATRVPIKVPRQEPAEILKEKFAQSPYATVPNGFAHFCASKVRATWKMSINRRMYLFHKHPVYTVAARLIQTAWKYFRLQMYAQQPLTPALAATKVQRAWRSYTNQKIFKYFKELISFRLKGNPRDLLKTINPGEAAMLDKATQVHVRFRLGGEKFPPLIYYKVYLHSGLCDVNSFAPRDYVAIKRHTKKTTVNITFEEDDAKQLSDGWYERYDNNGWRPITDNILSPFDRVELVTSHKPVPFHYSKLVRKELLAKRRREKKIAWLRKLYDEGKRLEELDEEAEVANDLSSFEESIEDVGNPFEVSNLIDLNEDEFEEYARGLMKWSDTLDFDAYLENWHQIATSAPIDSQEPAEY